ncbi:PREDICTED: uncharacterized protein LOC106108381 [Papilio polytes]|uniref:uncharacterized protein LOC106108381 n=1 Tax=Papilio polytes TaxID=76194 RepID=UPI0006760A00|nr:PREDICTED: uncharacterized protein LOC106108381 [Papilio polytes]
MVRLRVDHLASQNIRHLERRGCRLTNTQLIIMDNILEGRSSRLAHLNAYLVVVARHCFMPGSLHPNFNEPYLVPREFNDVRRHLQSYAQDLMIGARVEASLDPFEAVTDYILRRNSGFISSLMDMNSNNHIRCYVRPDVDLFQTFTNFFNSRMPRVLTLVTGPTGSDMFQTRYYSTIGTLHRDLLALILCCTNSERGMELIHRHFVNQLTEGLDEDTSLYINTLAQEIFHRINVTHAYASFHNLRMHLHLLSEYTVAQRIRSLNEDVPEPLPSLYAQGPSTSTLEPPILGPLEQRMMQPYEMYSAMPESFDSLEPMSPLPDTMNPGPMDRSPYHMPQTQGPYFKPTESPYSMSLTQTPEKLSIYRPDSPTPPQTPEILLTGSADSLAPLSPTPEPFSNRPQSPTLGTSAQTQEGYPIR